jgi:hypothetical protein
MPLYLPDSHLVGHIFLYEFGVHPRALPSVLSLPVFAEYFEPQQWLMPLLLSRAFVAAPPWPQLGQVREAGNGIAESSAGNGPLGPMQECCKPVRNMPKRRSSTRLQRSRHADFVEAVCPPKPLGMAPCNLRGQKRQNSRNWPEISKENLDCL